MPEEHGEHSRHTEHQRKGEKIPLLAQKVYVWISKKFHAVVKPLSSYSIFAFLCVLCGALATFAVKSFYRKVRKETAQDAKQPGLIAQV
jgi:hypothetical protein